VGLLPQIPEKNWIAEIQNILEKSLIKHILLPKMEKNIFPILGSAIFNH